MLFIRLITVNSKSIKQMTMNMPPL
ncbi:hypothetical protein EZS27_031133, partial [termite gut metagenome]